MKIRRIATAIAGAAVLAPALVLTAGSAAHANPPYAHSKFERCTIDWNNNYWSGGEAFARGQWKACMAE
ncbi:hypothetical protein [Embleya sp. NPDC059237]|uniref:hypothetical protein n=1 Tax=Embleya sp. NPDC059237 TaxID=3346784 RepID=UPI0036BEA0CC